MVQTLVRETKNNYAISLDDLLRSTKDDELTKIWFITRNRDLILDSLDENSEVFNNTRALFNIIDETIRIIDSQLDSALILLEELHNSKED